MGGAATRIPLAGIGVEDVYGRAVAIGDYVKRPTILVLPRYYGCAPCRDYLRQVSDRLDEIEAADGFALGVSVGTAQQARWLIEERGIEVPLLVDPQRRPGKNRLPQPAARPCHRR